MPGSNGARIVITERDRKLLNAITSVARIVDREQVMAIAGFDGVRRTNERLLLLTQAGLLRRCFTGTLAGGRKALYTPSQKGAALVGCTDFTPLSFRKDQLLVATSFLEHQLALNWVWIQAAFRPLVVAGSKFVRWVGFREPLSKSIPLIPDGYFELEHTNQIHPLFCEVDRGTETLKVWKRKILLYLKLAVSGDFEKQFHHPRFRVLVIANSERRVQGIRKTVLTQTDRIFRFTTVEQINREGLLRAAWLRPDGTPSPLL